MDLNKPVRKLVIVKTTIRKYGEEKVSYIYSFMYNFWLYSIC